MTSTTIKSSSGAAHRIEGHGLLIFASVLLVALYGLCVYGNRANVAP